jgi:hypothetical protein
MNFFNIDRCESHCGARKGRIGIRADQVSGRRQDKTRRVRDGRLGDEASLIKELAQCATIVKRLHAFVRIRNDWLYETLQEISP